MSFQNRKRVMRPRDYAKYRARLCNSLHFCEVCQKSITFGQSYHDGGYGRRAHTTCVPRPIDLEPPDRAAL